MPESSQEFDAFTAFMDKLIRVPHSTIKRGMTVHRKKAAANPNRPGPKPASVKIEHSVQKGQSEESE